MELEKINDEIFKFSDTKEQMEISRNNLDIFNDTETIDNYLFTLESYIPQLIQIIETIQTEMEKQKYYEMLTVLKRNLEIEKSKKKQRDKETENDKLIKSIEIENYSISEENRLKLYIKQKETHEEFIKKLKKLQDKRNEISLEISKLPIFSKIKRRDELIGKKQKSPGENTELQSIESDLSKFDIIQKRNDLIKELISTKELMMRNFAEIDKSKPLIYKIITKPKSELEKNAIKQERERERENQDTRLKATIARDVANKAFKKYFVLYNTINVTLGESDEISVVLKGIKNELDILSTLDDKEKYKSLNAKYTETAKRYEGIVEIAAKQTTERALFEKDFVEKNKIATELENEVDKLEHKNEFEMKSNFLKVLEELSKIEKMINTNERTLSTDMKKVNQRDMLLIQIEETTDAFMKDEYKKEIDEIMESLKEKLNLINLRDKLLKKKYELESLKSILKKYKGGRKTRRKSR